MIEVSNLPVPLSAGARWDSHPAGLVPVVVDRVAVALDVAPGAVSRILLKKRSVDARKKSQVHFIASVGVELCDSGLEERILSQPTVQAGKPFGPLGVRVAPWQPYERFSIPQIGDCQAGRSSTQDVAPIVVVGTGPAGLFCAWALAQAGARVVVLERGGQVQDRLTAVAAFNAGGPLNPESNIQFGEGGAGTFSDGKLTTGIKSPYCAHVLHAFVEYGAPKEILWQAKPHIGTDRLVEVVAAMRQDMIGQGAQVRFDTRMDDLVIEDGKVAAVMATNVRSGTQERIPASRVVLACGHSARDTLEMLAGRGLTLRRKPFSVGVRIEHPQSLINRIQYGRFASHEALGAADYKLSCHLKDGRGVYTFCMCPGGQVVCAASEEGGVCVNGMSEFARDGNNANSALLVAVNPEDLAGEDPLAGIELQRQIERAAFHAAGEGYQAPSQRVGDYLAAAAGASGKRSSAAKAFCERLQVEPTYARGVVWTDLTQVLPGFVSTGLAQGLQEFDRRMPGFAHPDAVLTAPETRSSSPVRIVRDPETYQAYLASGPAGVPASGTADEPADEPACSGIYPCGEGAGYAGGIMSAAVDGLRVAFAIVNQV